MLQHSFAEMLSVGLSHGTGIIFSGHPSHGQGHDAKIVASDFSQVSFCFILVKTWAIGPTHVALVAFTH